MLVFLISPDLGSLSVAPSLRIFRLAENLEDGRRIALDHHQIGLHAAQRARAFLLPIANLIDRKTKLGGKVILLQVQLTPDGPHTKPGRYVELARPGIAANNLQSLGEAAAFLSKAFLLTLLHPSCAVLDVLRSRGLDTFRDTRPGIFFVTF
jgi:hypothetical protein